jgi:predicted dehydrogenase
VQDFAKAIIENRPPLIDPMYGYHAVQVVEAAYRSMATGRLVVIEEQ